ncbi:MAG: response regulator [Pseudomonadota bacterium]
MFLKRNFVTSIYDNAEKDVVRKVILMHGIALLGMVFLAVLGTLALYQKAHLLALFDFLTLFFLGIVLGILRRTGKYIFCCFAGVVVMYCLYLFLFFSGGVNGTGFMWHYTFPLFALYLLGSRNGGMAAVTLLIPTTLFLLFDIRSETTNLYTRDFAYRFIPSYLAVFMFSYMFEKSRENAHRELENAYLHQEKMVEERTAQLKQEIEMRESIGRRLRQAQKMEAIGLMAGGVAHDLNNILSGIVTYPELLLHQLPENSDLRQPLLSIKESGKKAAAVVADLLTVARGVATPKKVCDLSELIADFLSSPECRKIQELYPGIRWVNFSGKEKIPVLCSSVHISKCFMNLALNAAEAIGSSGTITFSLNAAQRRDYPETVPQIKGEHVVLCVSDDGPGIEDKDLEHIFEPFFTKKVMGRSGTGLGLAVVWNTVQDHDGFIMVRSGLNGTAFDLFFPRAEAEIEERIHEIPLETLQGAGKVLVVDDEEQQREICRKILTMLGYTVTTVSSGEGALQFLRNSKVDLIILDMLMEPGLNGRQTYEKILELHPGQRALIVSGFAESDDVRRAIDMGAGALLKKPYSIEEMGAAVKREISS